ncbi:type II secretion system protein GspL [Maricaulaceae bacterium MS644]
MSVLVITLSADAEAADAGWALVCEGAILDEGRMAPGQAPDLKGARPDRTVALLPAEAVFLRRVAAPGGSDRYARRAAPFLIEDHLAGGLEETAVEIGPRAPDGLRMVAGVSTALRDAWRRLAAGAGIKPVYAVPDALAAEAGDADLFVFESGGRVLFKTHAGASEAAGRDTGPRDADAALNTPLCGAIEADLAGFVLPALTARLAPKTVRVSEGVDPALAAPEGTPVEITRATAPDLRLCAAGLDPAWLQTLAPVLGAGLASDLNWGELLAPWRAAAVLGLAACLGVTALAGGQAMYYEHRTGLYRDAEIAVFQEAFPEVGRVTRVQTQLRQQLARVGAPDGGADFLALAAALGRLTQGEEAVEVTAIRYDSARGALQVSARYSGFDVFERLRTRAGTLDVVLEDGGARQAETGVVGDFTVRLP